MHMLDSGFHNYYIRVHIFSTVENIEGQWAMSGKPLTNLSVEQVVDCDGMEDVKGYVVSVIKHTHILCLLIT